MGNSNHFGNRRRSVLVLIVLALSALLLWHCSDDEPTGPNNSTPVNHAPQFASVSSQNVQVGETLEFTVTASDSDDDSLSLSCVNPPTGATFVDSTNGRALFAFSPADSQIAVFQVRFVVSDGRLTDTLDVQVTVLAAPNRAPVLNAPDSLTVGMLATLHFTVTATDPDGTIPTVTALSLPTNATFVINHGYGYFSFVPDALQVGKLSVIFVASDGELADTAAVVITVTIGGYYRPEMNVEGNFEVMQGDTTVLTITAATLNNTSALWIIADSLPENAKLEGHGQGLSTLTFTPDYVQLGVYPARIIARDGFGLADTATIEFEVLDAPNQAPVIERIYSQSVFPGQELRIDVVASDVDGTIPTLELIVAPDNMTFEDYGDGIGSLTMIPDSSQFGEHAVMVTASDGELADTSAFSVTVALDTATFFQDGLIPCAVGNQWTYETIRCLGYGDCVVSRPETTTVTVTSLEFADGRLWWYLDRRWMFLGSRFAVSGDTIFYGNGSEIIFEDGRSWTVVVNPDEYWGVSYNHHIHFYEEPCLCGGFEPELGQSRFDYQISGSFGPAYGMHYEGTRYSLVPGIGFVCHIDLYGEMSYSDGDGQRLIDYEIREPE